METVTILTRAVPNIFSLNDLEWLWLLQKYFQRHGTWRTLPLLRQPITARHSSLCCRMNRKGKSLINNISIGRFCGINSYNRCSNHRMVSFDTDTALQSFYHSFIVLPMIRCSKLAQKSAVQVKKKVNERMFFVKFTPELRDATCQMGSHSVICYPTGVSYCWRFGLVVTRWLRST